MTASLHTHFIRRPQTFSLAPTMPREHGAWFVLAASSLLGPAVTGGLSIAHGILLAIGWLGLIGHACSMGRRPLDRVHAALFLGIAGVLGLSLLARLGSPLLYGAAAATAVLGAWHAWLRRHASRHELGTEMVGMGLLSVAGAASLALSGREADLATIGVIVANTSFFLATVPYVRLRVFGRKDRALWEALRTDPLTLGVAGAFVMALCVQPAAALAFALPIARSARMARTPPGKVGSFTRLGLLEVLVTVTYVGVLFATATGR